MSLCCFLRQKVLFHIVSLHTCVSRGCSNISSRFMLQKLELSASLIGHLARVPTLPLPYLIRVLLKCEYLSVSPAVPATVGICFPPLFSPPPPPPRRSGMPFLPQGNMGLAAVGFLFIPLWLKARCRPCKLGVSSFHCLIQLNLFNTDTRCKGTKLHEFSYYAGVCIIITELEFI